MCGILGAVGLFESYKFSTALRQLAHRGPDGEAIWLNEEGNVKLGHRRLAILDLSDSGIQPMTDGHLTIVFNGEIFNYVELRKQLVDKGHVFKSLSDTEVILKAFREWGSKCVEKFNGMWAFALWDANLKKMFLARDRFGVKPLFYAFTNSGFVFGSEMKAIAPLLDHILLSKDFNWCLNNIYAYEGSEKSLIEGIQRFPAGHTGYYSVNDKNLKLQKYWETLDHLTQAPSDYECQVEEFRTIFLDAVKIRMRSDVKIGTSLSGGLDSSSVAAAMRHCSLQSGSLENLQPDWQNAFIATFKGTYLDEQEYAEEVVNTLKLRGHFYEIDASEGIEQLDDYLWYLEELYLTTPIPMTNIYKAIRKSGISVTLDGHGADELLAGYGTTMFKAIQDDPFNIHSIKEVIATYKQQFNINKGDFEALVDGFAGRKNMLQFYLRKMLRIAPEEELVKRLGYFNAALYKEFHHFILPTLLRNYDRYSMAASVEVRMPFMDYRLVTLTFSLPWQSKLRGGYTKAILRDAIRPYLSSKIVNRKTKIGFSTPLTHWFLGPWKEFVLDTIHTSTFRNSSVIEPDKVESNILKFFAKPKPTPEDGLKVWKDLMPYLWENSFYKKIQTIA